MAESGVGDPLRDRQRAPTQASDVARASLIDRRTHEVNNGTMNFLLPES